MEKIWLQSYEAGVPAEINPDAYQSIIEVFDKSSAEHLDRPAFYNMGTTLSFSQTIQYSIHFAAYLQKELRLEKGERFAIMLPNLLQYPIAMFGILRAGLVVVNVNPLYRPDELVHQLKDAKVCGILIVENFAATLQKALPDIPSLKHIIITRIGDLLSPFRAIAIHIGLKYIYRKIPAWNIKHALYFKDVLTKGKHLHLDPVQINHHDSAFLQYTGGTTGVSKGAILTHRNIIANIQQADAWFKNLLHKQEEIIITALPLYHIFSLLANCLFFSKMGGLNVLITNPRNLPEMIKEMGKFKFTAITGVNTLFNGLIKYPEFAKLDFSHLHLALGGGMAVQRIVAEKWQEITRSPLLEAYGLTETSPCVTINPAHLKQYNGSIGLPVSSTDVAILDEEGRELGIGASGELGVKGPQVMKGYWENEEETKKVFTKEGWLLTGDIASIDDKGFIRILERKKDMILVSGFNVYPNEIEEVIAKLPGVKEVAVIGVNDENSGEIPKAFVVKDDPNLSAATIIQYCHEHLTPYKVPKKISFKDDLPKSNVGKILRRELKKMACEG